MRHVALYAVSCAARVAAAALLLVGASLIAPVTAYAVAGEVWLQGAGATFPAPLYKRWIDVFHQQNPSISLTYDAVGSGEGISRFVTRSVDFAGSDAGLSEANAAKVEGGSVVIPATAGMVVIAYNLPGVSGKLRLPRDVYPEIFAGKIKKWNDPRIQAANPEITLPNRNIVVVARQDSSGTTFAFTDHLGAISPSWQTPELKPGMLVSWPGAMLARGNEGVAGRIKISEGSLGYVEYGFAKRLGLPVAALQNKAGEFVLPSEPAAQRALAQAIAWSKDSLQAFVTDPTAAGAYPIVTYTWLLLYKRYGDPAKGAAVTKFVDWALVSGQPIGSEMGYIALPAEVSARGREALASIRY